MLSVEAVGLSSAMNITFSSEDPAKAALVANTIASTYVDSQLQLKGQLAQRSVQWLTDRIAALSRQAQKADAAVQQYKAENGLHVTADGSSVVDQQINSLSTQLILARADLAQKQAAYGGLSSLSQASRAADSGQAVASPLIAQLRSQEALLNGQIADVSSKYGPLHPRMIDLQAQKATLEAKIDQEVQRFVAAGRSDMQIAQQRVAAIEASLAGLEAQKGTQNKSGVKLSALQTESDTIKAQYQAFIARLGMIQDQNGIQSSTRASFRMPRCPRLPASPTNPCLLPRRFPPGSCSGCWFAFGAEHLNPGFRTSAEAESMLGIPVLSVVPEMKRVAKSGVFPAEMVPRSPIPVHRGDPCGTTGYSFFQCRRPAEGDPGRILHVGRRQDHGGGEPGAACRRRGARTIIVDGDLRRPSVAGSIGLPASPHGLIEAVAGQEPLERCIKKDPQSELRVLPCHKAPPNGADILASHAMRDLIAKLAQNFDLVVIDSSPVLPVTDAKILGRLADMTLFVVRWERTPREAVANAVRSLLDAQVPVSGLVLARADAARSRFYDHGYQSYSGYASYHND